MATLKFNELIFKTALIYKTLHRFLPLQNFSKQSDKPITSQLTIKTFSNKITLSLWTRKILMRLYIFLKIFNLQMFFLLFIFYDTFLPADSKLEKKNILILLLKSIKLYSRLNLALFRSFFFSKFSKEIKQSGVNLTFCFWTSQPDNVPNLLLIF